MKFNELGRSFFRKMVQIRSNFATTCTIKGTRGAKSPIDATFSGRSMVEMLGVLAIIGVLSVGALSGYSTAMNKYKLNKHLQQISLLLNITYVYYENIVIPAGEQSSLLPYFQKMNLIPDGMVWKNGYLYDSLGCRISVYKSVNTPSKTVYIGVRYENISDKSVLIQSCVQILNLVKEYYNTSLHRFYMLQIASNSSSYVSFFGDGVVNCSQNICMKDVSPATITQTCTETMNNATEPSISIGFYGT